MEKAHNCVRRTVLQIMLNFSFSLLNWLLKQLHHPPLKRQKRGENPILLLLEPETTDTAPVSGLYLQECCRGNNPQDFID